MKSKFYFLLSVIIFQSIAGIAQPQYKSTGAKNIVTKMVAAHGGIDKWNKASALSYSHILVFGEPLGTEFWLSNEAIEIKTEKAYHDWPMFNGKLGYDGKKIWTENWKLDNPPGANLNNIYHALAMPFFTQNKNVVLEELPKARILGGAISGAALNQFADGNSADANAQENKGIVVGDSAEYYVIKLTYAAGSHGSPHQYYKLFIDPQTYLLTALEFNITYAPFLDLIGLPKEQKSFGPFTHVYYTYVKQDGLIFPEKYDSFDGQGHNSGRHIAFNYSIKRPFDAKRMVMPLGAVVANEKSDR